MPRKKKENKVPTTNIKVTVPTHKEIQVATELTGMTQSEVISAALKVLLPNLPEEVSLLDERQQEIDKKRQEISERLKNLK